MKQEEVNNNNSSTRNHSNNNPVMSIESVCRELSSVCQVMSQCNDVIKSMEDVAAILPYCSDLLSEMNEMVRYAADTQHQQQQQHMQHDEAELWWDSSPENVAYSECDTVESAQCYQSDNLCPALKLYFGCLVLLFLSNQIWSALHLSRSIELFCRKNICGKLTK